MAYQAYLELDKARDSSSSRSSLHENRRLSTDSDDRTSINELDPLDPNGFRVRNGSADSIALKKEAYAFPSSRMNGWDVLKEGRLRLQNPSSWWLPLRRLERWMRTNGVRTHVGIPGPKRIRRRIRRCLPVVPGRICCLLMGLLAGFVLLITATTGVYVYKKGTMDGYSEPWYPTPLGGKVKSWEDSYDKAAQLVRRMTLAEKVNVTTGTGWMMGMCVGNTGPASLAGFPSLCLQDGPLGLRYTDHITASPAGITVGATWNKALMFKRGRMLGLEARAKGINVLLGPSVGPLGKLPAGGRNWEGFGSDPVLQGRAAAETIRGIQQEGVMATVKHFVGNEQEHFRRAMEWNLPNSLSSNIDDRTLHELYAWPFADSIRAGVAAIMCSYNQVNNSYACQNSKLINGILKDELGFQGFVVSDWLAQRSGVASALAGLDMSMPGDGKYWANGVPFWGSQLSLSVLNGTVPVERLNDMTTRIVAAWYQLKQDNEQLWPRPPPDGDGGPNFSSWTDSENGFLHPGSGGGRKGVVNKFVEANKGRFSHRSLSRQIAAEGIVLLKNERKMLPLSRQGWSQDVVDSGRSDVERYNIGIFGEDSALPKGGPNACVERACNKGTLATGWGSGAVEFPYLVSPLEALQSAFYDTVNISSIPTNALPSKLNNTRIEEQDLCLVFANAAAGEGFISSGGIKGDRNDLGLQKGGDKLINDVARMCGSQNPRNKVGQGEEAKYKLSPTVVVLHSVGPVVVEPFIDNPNVRAVVMAHLPGQESGYALMDVLLGDVNPSGHLPYTIGRNISEYGKSAKVMYYPNAVVPQQNFSEGLLIDYRWFDAHKVPPRFAFGFGLSYTSFSLKNIQIRPVLQNRPEALPDPRPANEISPPQYNNAIPSPQEALLPSGFRRLRKYVYPYISSAKEIKQGTYRNYPDMSQHPDSKAGGREGGNPSLWEELVFVDVTVVNEGERDGQAVVQLYVTFPEDVWEEFDETWDEVLDREGEENVIRGANAEKRSRSPGRGREKIEFPRRVLRGFEKVHTYTQTKAKDPSIELDRASVTFSLTRRDLSYWSVRQQNWILPPGRFGIHVGFSSRDIRVSGNVF